MTILTFSAVCTELQRTMRILMYIAVWPFGPPAQYANIDLYSSMPTLTYIAECPRWPLSQYARIDLYRSMLSLTSSAVCPHHIRQRALVYLVRNSFSLNCTAFVEISDKKALLMQYSLEWSSQFRWSFCTSHHLWSYQKVCTNFATQHCRYLLTPPTHGTGERDFFGCDVGKQGVGGRMTSKWILTHSLPAI